ncbi:hypothetical protein NDU88_008178 [Pleurodeles waltl]|uniref:Uncharacterized protein n=1 Tax=Pleurodeles waltl TaxID=8319 RepID=A0AAV7RX81_PLEWA|nr:hypothetical protein NDU88_008178 [Pleurodeles waltl]
MLPADLIQMEEELASIQQLSPDDVVGQRGDVLARGRASGNCTVKPDLKRKGDITKRTWATYTHPLYDAVSSSLPYAFTDQLYLGSGCQRSPLIATSIFSLQPKESEDLHAVKHLESGRRHSTDHKTSNKVGSFEISFGINRDEYHLDPPDCIKRDHGCTSSGQEEREQILNFGTGLRVEQDFESSLMENQCAEDEESTTGLNSEHVDIRPVASFIIKEEDDPYNVIHDNSERGDNTGSPTRFPFLNSELAEGLEDPYCVEGKDSNGSLTSGFPATKHPDSLHIKEEQETYCIDDSDQSRSISSPKCNRVPAIHQGPAPHRPRSKAPGQGSSASHRQFRRAPRSTTHSSGASTTRRRAPRLSPIIRGPQEGPSALNPRRPGRKGRQGEGPSRGPGRASLRLHPNYWAEPAPPAGAAQPGSDRCRRTQNTRGDPRDAGKASRPPQTGHRSLFRAEAAERKQERPSAPPS